MAPHVVRVKSLTWLSRPTESATATLPPLNVPFCPLPHSTPCSLTSFLLLNQPRVLWRQDCLTGCSITSLLQLLHRLAARHLGLSSSDTMPQKSLLNAWSKNILQPLSDMFFVIFTALIPSEIILLIYLAVSFSSNTVPLWTRAMSSSPTISSAHWVSDLVL